MSLTRHLIELRRRIVRAAAGILVGSIIGYLLSDMVLSAARLPVTELAAQEHRLASLNFQGLADAFDLRLQIAFVLGIVIASPVWLYQIWAFLVPAMTRRELKFALGFFLSGVPLFLAGCAVGWLVVPRIVSLMLSFAPAGSASFLQAGDYIGFIMKLMVAVGIAFVMPAFLVLLDFVGILSGRAIFSGWRVAVITTVLFSAVATPSADVVSMFLLAIPMLTLYALAGGIALLHDRQLERRLDSAANALLPAG